MRIGIIGLGYVGLTLAIAAADCGIEVYKSRPRSDASGALSCRSILICTSCL